MQPSLISVAVNLVTVLDPRPISTTRDILQVKVVPDPIPGNIRRVAVDHLLVHLHILHHLLVHRLHALLLGLVEDTDVLIAGVNIDIGVVIVHHPAHLHPHRLVLVAFLVGLVLAVHLHLLVVAAHLHLLALLQGVMVDANFGIV